MVTGIPTTTHQNQGLFDLHGIYHKIMKSKHNRQLRSTKIACILNL